jgi:hypothetical protein
LERSILLTDAGRRKETAGCSLLLSRESGIRTGTEKMDALPAAGFMVYESLVK